MTHDEEIAGYDDLVDEVDKLNNRVLDLLAENGRLRDQLADMARDTVVAFALEVSSDDPTIEKAKQILRDMGREDEIPDY